MNAQRDADTDGFIIKVVQDGNQYVALIGDDLQSGYGGFGDTPRDAITDLIKVHNEMCITAGLPPTMDAQINTNHWTYTKG